MTPTEAAVRCVEVAASMVRHQGVDQVVIFSTTLYDHVVALASDATKGVETPKPALARAANKKGALPFE